MPKMEVEHHLFKIENNHFENRNKAFFDKQFAK